LNRQGSFAARINTNADEGGVPRNRKRDSNLEATPRGSRNKLSDAFLQALADDFEAHGKGVVEKVRTERPQDYLKIVASVMPKRMEVEDVGPPRRAADLSDDELAAIIAGAKLTVV